MKRTCSNGENLVKYEHYEWHWNPNLKWICHQHEVKRDVLLEDVLPQPTEHLYWQGKPQRVWLRLGNLLILLFSLVIATLCFTQIKHPLMYIFGCLFSFPMIFCYIQETRRLMLTDYYLTDYRVIIYDRLSNKVTDYELGSYLLRYFGHPGKLPWWQPSNRWDITMIQSRILQSYNHHYATFYSITKADVATIKAAISAIRVKFNAPKVHYHHFSRNDLALEDIVIPTFRDAKNDE